MTDILSLLKPELRRDQPAASDAHSRLTYGELQENYSLLAQELRQRHIKRLALHADNSLAWITADLACQSASVCLVPLPTFFSSQQIEHVLKTIPVDAVLCEKAEVFSAFEGDNVTLEPGLQVFPYQLRVLAHSGQTVALPDNTQKVTFTSGSTGQPKGVCLSNDQLACQAHALADAVNLNNPRHLCLLPLSTLLENVAGIYSTLLAGGEVLLPSLAELGFSGSSSFDLQAFTGTISRYQPDTLITTPQLLQAMVCAAENGWQPPATLNFVAVGGARVSEKLLSRAHALHIPAYEGYGLSECASVVSLNTPEHNDQASSGRPLPHLQVSIEDGEVLVAGNAMLGYVGDQDSWYPARIPTGDLGYLNDEGYLVINGRKKNLLISSFGRNISPEWVESELLTHPEIAECVVLGDARPYCVALIWSAKGGAQPQLQRLIDKTNAELPDYARIVKWHYLEGSVRQDKYLFTDNGRPRRKRIEASFGPLIEALYSQSDNPLTHKGYALTHTG
jgi:long-subunit acyl-CoA synthetase (AMP-forming)